MSKPSLNCPLGLYKIFWKLEEGGGVSLAAVGNNREGRRWLAPVNWISQGALLEDSIRNIEKMELIHVELED